MIKKSNSSLQVKERDKKSDRLEQFAHILTMPPSFNECYEFTTKNISAWRTAFASVKPEGRKYTIKNKSEGVYKIWRIL